MSGPACWLHRGESSATGPRPQSGSHCVPRAAVAKDTDECKYREHFPMTHTSSTRPPRAGLLTGRSHATLEDKLPARDKDKMREGLARTGPSNPCGEGCSPACRPQGAHERRLLLAYRHAQTPTRLHSRQCTSHIHPSATVHLHASTNTLTATVARPNFGTKCQTLQTSACVQRARCPEVSGDKVPTANKTPFPGRLAHPWWMANKLCSRRTAVGPSDPSKVPCKVITGALMIQQHTLRD